MLAGIGYLLGPLGKIGSLIIDHFKGHSPPPLGPMHQLNRVKLVRTIADTMTPAPMLSAVRRVALVTALAAPMMVGAGAPALAAGAGSARVGGAIEINISFKFEHPGELTDAEIERKGKKIAQVVDRELTRRSRTEF
jgi:hypothetical protein